MRATVRGTCMNNNLYLPQYVLKKKFGIREAPDQEKQHKDSSNVCTAQSLTPLQALSRGPRPPDFWCVTRERLRSAATCPQTLFTSPFTRTAKSGQDVECNMRAI